MNSLKKAIFTIGLICFTIGVDAQGIIGLGYTNGAENSCSKPTVCSASGFRIRPLNNSLEAEKDALKNDLTASNSSCTNIEYSEFAKGDVVVIFIISVSEGGCKWNKFVLGQGKSEEEAIQNAEALINNNAEDVLDNLGRLETVYF